METKQTLNWQNFKEALWLNPALYLQFQYAEGKRVAASYHITEVKQAPIVSVDCGGVANKWTEIIVQLWEPAQQEQDRAMVVRKALSIIDVVESKLTLEASAVVKIEFGNSQFDTRQMYPGSITVEGENLVVDLRPDFTQCKAIGRGGSCGTDDPKEMATGKSLVPLSAIPASNSCTVGSGCC